MAGDVMESTHVLFVTGPMRERLYRRFCALFDGRDDVEVRIDRRVAERRREQREPAGVERRRVRDRRQARPEWMVPPPEGPLTSS